MLSCTYLQAGGNAVTEASAASQTLVAESYSPRNPGPYLQDMPPENQVRFTPVQVSAPRPACTCVRSPDRSSCLGALILVLLFSEGPRYIQRPKDQEGGCLCIELHCAIRTIEGCGLSFDQMYALPVMMPAGLQVLLQIH